MKTHASPKSSSAGGAPRSARPPPSNRSKAAVTGTAAPTPSTAPAKKQKYTVIITNVENDFAKLHSACIPYYCGLRGDYEETHDAERIVREGGRPTARLIAAQRGCSYAVRCRTETRTAEVSLFGPADADFAAMQLVKPPRRPTPTPTPPAAKKAPRGGGDGDATGVTEPAVVVVPAPAAADAGAADSAAAVPLDVGGVERLALRLRRQRYFEEKLPVSVHLPGRAADEVLVRLTKPSEAGTGHEGGAGGDDEDSSEDETSEEVDGEEDEEDGRVGTPGAKRAREGVASGAEAATAEGGAPTLQRVKTEASDDDDGENVAKPGDEKKADAAAEGETREKEKKPRTKRVSKAHTLIKQFPSRQRDFVSAVAALSTRTPLRRVRRRLHDLPGYLSCWTLYDRHLRVVFRDAESLFKAKQLLDQFELEAGLRVSLTMSDPLSRTNAEFTRAQESENAME